MSNSASLKKALPGLSRIMRYFWPHVKSQRLLICGSLLALFGEVGLRLLEPWPLKFVFDHVIVPKGELSGFLGAFASASPLALLAGAAAAVVCITGLRAFASFRQTVGFARLGTRALLQVRKQLYLHVQYLSLSFHTNSRTGDLVVRMMNDVSMLQDVAVTALFPLVAKALVVAGMLGLMFWMQWRLALIALLVFPLFWLRSIRIGKKIREVAAKQRRQEGAMAANFAESITAIRTVQALSLEKNFASAFSGQSEQNLKQDLKGKRLSAGLERTVDVLIAVATALVLYYGATLVLRRQMTAGELLVFLAYLKSAYRPVQDFAKYTGRLGKASAAGERVIDLLERVPDVRDLPGAQKAPPLRGHIRFEKVRFAYDRSLPVLVDLDLELPVGQKIAILGSSGSGKTTLASLILRLYEPSAGRVTVDGHDVRGFTLESLRGQISMVLQDNVLFAATVFQNIAYGSPGANLNDVEAAARLANADEFIRALPQGYDTPWGNAGPRSPMVRGSALP